MHYYVPLNYEKYAKAKERGKRVLIFLRKKRKKLKRLVVIGTEPSRTLNNPSSSQSNENLSPCRTRLKGKEPIDFLMMAVYIHQ